MELTLLYFPLLAMEIVEDSRETSSMSDFSDTEERSEAERIKASLGNSWTESDTFLERAQEISPSYKDTIDEWKESPGLREEIVNEWLLPSSLFQLKTSGDRSPIEQLIKEWDFIPRSQHDDAVATRLLGLSKLWRSELLEEERLKVKDKLDDLDSRFRIVVLLKKSEEAASRLHNSTIQIPVTQTFEDEVDSKRDDEDQYLIFRNTPGEECSNGERSRKHSFLSENLEEDPTGSLDRRQVEDKRANLEEKIKNLESRPHASQSPTVESLELEEYHQETAAVVRIITEHNNLAKKYPYIPPWRRGIGI